MNYEQKTLPITKLVSNSGQIAGVPKNPRTIKDARFNALKKSIEDAPEMLSLRELIVVPFGDKFVTICGNMRLSAARDLGMKSMPCKVLAEDTPATDTRKREVGAFNKTNRSTYIHCSNTLFRKKPVDDDNRKGLEYIARLLCREWYRCIPCRV